MWPTDLKGCFVCVNTVGLNAKYIKMQYLAKVMSSKNGLAGSDYEK